MPQVAVFDTAFHATMPEDAAVYAVPRRWREEWGIRRYGFHGLSVQWAAERVPVPRLVVCHLGGGCSVTAVRDGRSVDTTMGFSPLDGVPMATRSGAVDPEIVLHLLRTGTARRRGDRAGARARVGPARALGHFGDGSKSSSSPASPERGSPLPSSRTALPARSPRWPAALGGLDALVFTGGVGEQSSAVRAAVCDRLQFVGVELDADRNRQAHPDAEITGPGSSVRVVVLGAREDVVAARAARDLLGRAS